MKILLRHILTALILTAFLGGVASAMPAVSHHSHSDHHKSLSPFGIKHGKRLHCELLGHNPLLPCPHHNKPAGKKKNCLLTSDCGGGSFPAPNSQSAGDYPRFLKPLITTDENLPSFATVLAPTSFYDALFFSSLDRPPQAL